jgi:hypothetical protein
VASLWGFLRIDRFFILTTVRGYKIANIVEWDEKSGRERQPALSFWLSLQAISANERKRN